MVSRLACGSAQVEAAREANEPITVTLPDGMEVRAWRRAASAVPQLRYLAKVHSWQRLLVVCSLLAALLRAQALPDTALQAPGAAAPDQRPPALPAVTMSARLFCTRHHKRAQRDRAAVGRRRAVRHRRETGGAA